MPVCARRWQTALLAAVLALVSSPPCALAQELPLRVELLGEPHVDADAGVAVTLVFQLTNPAGVARAVSARIDAPAGWQVLFARERVELQPHSSTLELVTLVPPRSVSAGDYAVRYEVRPAQADSYISAAATVTIHERRDTRIEWRNAPAYLQSGASGTLELLVTNHGNVPATMQLELQSARGSTITPSWSGGTLGAGEAKRVPVDVSAPRQSFRAVRERLTASAVTDRVATPARATAYVEIIPSAAARGSDARSARLPVTLTLRGGTNRDPGLGSLAGGGALDAAGTHLIEFAALSRDRSHPFMVEQDRYYLRFQTPALRMALGDQIWSLSRLTEAGRYGFGGGGEMTWAHAFAGAFLDTGRRDFAQSAQAGGFAGLRLGGVGRASVQHLVRFADNIHSERLGNLTTLRLQLEPLAGWRGDLELGTGQSPAGSGGAFSGELAYTSPHVSWAVQRTRADVAYPIRNRAGVTDMARLSVRPFEQLLVQGTLNATGRADDPRLPPDAPSQRRQTQAMVRWGRLLRVTANRREWTSPGMSWEHGWRRESVNAQMRIPLGPFGLTPGVERGVEAGPPTAIETPFTREWLRADLRFGQGNSLYVRGEQRRGLAGAADRLRRSVSFGGQLRPAGTTTLALQLNDSVDNATWFQGTRWLNATVDHRLPWEHRIVATYRRLSSATAFVRSDKALRLDYVIPLGIPLKRTDADAGRVVVRLRDDASRPLDGIVIRLGGEPLLTDRDGTANFTRLAQGERYLTIDPGALGPDRLAIPELPLSVAVTRGKRIDVEIMVVRAARVTGTFLRLPSAVTGPPAANPQTAVASPEGVAGAVLELVSAGHRRLATTDGDGRFEFAGLPPGEWRLTVVRADVPAFYDVEEPSRTFTLGAGENHEVLLRLVPKPIQINGTF